MNTIKLYNYFRSSTSFRVRIALELKKLSYEYIPVHLLNNGGEQNSEAYKKLNPMGGVPTLVHGTETIGQSYAILEYLDEAFPETAQLLPKDVKLKAHIRQFCQIINADTHAYSNLKTLKYLEKKLMINEDQKNEWNLHWLNEGLTACEKMLEKFHGKYCFGNTITMADAFLVPQLVTAMRFNVDIKTYPTLFKIYENCMNVEAFIKAHPFRQVDTPDDLRIK